MGEILRDKHLVPDLILCSTAARAVATAQAAIEASGYEGDVGLSRELYLAAPPTYVAVLQRQPDDAARVLVIGHNPGLEELLELLTGRAEPLPTAALAALELPIEHWNELVPTTQGRLTQLWRPKELED